MRPDVALELGWLNGYQNFIMPFLVQNMRQTYDRLKVLEKRTQPPAEEDAQDQIAQTYGQLGGFGNGMLMIGNGDMGMGGPPPQMGGMPGGGVDMSGFAQPGMQNGGMPQGMPPGGMPSMGSM